MRVDAMFIEYIILIYCVKYNMIRLGYNIIIMCIQNRLV